ncbi:SMP-30/gluconolactonase/LRE family protein [Streptomyces cylindrosporus]|uniref:SMP-30/gluconolactonase/LRE family protein n=1 Tax=Streptomyces cylindrosporus TaxID=2927583 RepID=A0ABS9Y6L9_9ACTN|nr:SMP-30/gluconolactonase/LRE family protein [Streptomyces cylindrosporus]MCI3272854.1 SMP-30/gluconolactonase/LRE family protein [Streptomyces cylindrosporus]
MSRSIHRRTFLTGATAVAFTAALPATAARAAGVRLGTAFTLPGERVYPEGIALDPRTGAAYVGSYANGAVYRAVPGSRAAEVFLPAGADGRNTANGLKVDRAGRLWVIDSTAGVDVYDLRDRSLIARFTVPADGPHLVNDLVITADGTAYVTDSLTPVIYRVTPADVARGGLATLVPRHDLSGVLAPHPSDAFTLNGIVADPAGRHLYVVDMTGGDLYRVAVATGAVRRVTLIGGDLTHGDGLELAHGRLWAAQNASNTLSRWRLSADGASARLERRFTDSALQVPTTLVRAHGRLLVVRSQFDKGGPMGPGVPEEPFTVAWVDGI